MLLRYVLIFLLTLTACSGQYFGLKENKPTDLLAVSYRLADQMHGQLSDNNVSIYPMLATSFVNSANMEKSNDLGKLLSEQIASRLSQLGYPVLEMQMQSSRLTVKPDTGVSILSRDLLEINTDVVAYSVLVGTYTTINRQIYVNARILRVQDGVALASADANLPFIRSKERGNPGEGIQVSAGASLK